VESEWQYSYVSVSRAIYSLIGCLVKPESISQKVEIPSNLEIYLEQLCSSSWILSSISDTFSDFASFHQELHNTELRNSSDLSINMFSFFMKHLEKLAQKIDAFFNQSFCSNGKKLEMVRKSYLEAPINQYFPAGFTHTLQNSTKIKARNYLG
jgi:hypothetical protein